MFVHFSVFNTLILIHNSLLNKNELIIMVIFEMFNLRFEVVKSRELVPPLQILLLQTEHCALETSSGHLMKKFQATNIVTNKQ